jgi:3-hydroxyacyl-CoA dehydrogenase
MAAHGAFRLADLVGIDILARVAANFPQGVEQGKFSAVLAEIVKRNWLGDKTGQGFYKKSRGADGKEERQVLDLTTFEYRPTAKPALPSLDVAKNVATAGERLRLLLANDPGKDKAPAFSWPLLSSLWNFAADRIGEAAVDAQSNDQAMRAEFNWEMGPFEMWDATSVATTVARMKALGIARARALDRCLPPVTRPSTRPTAWHASRQQLGARGLSRLSPVTQGLRSFAELIG